MRVAKDSRDLVKRIRRESRKALMPKGGRHGTQKGGRGYSRKTKHSSKGWS